MKPLTDLADPVRIPPNDHLVDSPDAGEALGPSLLQKVWGIVWLNRFLVAGIVVASTVVALVATLLATPEFTSTARVQISRIEANVSDVEGLEPQGDALAYEEFYRTQYALLESPSLAERVARALNLASDEEFREAFDIDPEGEIASGSPRQAIEAVSQVLLENVAVTPVVGSSLVDIQFTSPSPALSAKIAAAWVDEFIATSIERRFAATNDAREFLQEQLGQLRERLEDSERQFVSYASNSGIFTIDGTRDDGSEGAGETLASDDLSSMNAALALARSERVAAEAALRAGDVDGTDPVTTTLQSRRAQLAAERARLLTQFESGYPQIEALTSELEQLDR